jgi:hypothetical protein
VQPVVQRREMQVRKILVPAAIAQLAERRPPPLRPILKPGRQVRASIDHEKYLFPDHRPLQAGVFVDRDQKSALAITLSHRMGYVGQIEYREVEGAKRPVLGIGHAFANMNLSGGNAPIGMGQGARGHGAIDDPELSRALLDHHPPGKNERIDAGIDHRLAGRSGAHPYTADHLVEPRRIDIDVHGSVVGLDGHVSRTFDLQMSIGFDIAGVLVVAHFVGAHRVVAVPEGDFAYQRVGVAINLLLRRLDVHWFPPRRRG